MTKVGNNFGKLDLHDFGENCKYCNNKKTNDVND